MTEKTTQSVANLGYHAHIYYDPERTRDVAAALREQIGERFLVQIGRWHDNPVGPHSRAMYQVAFTVGLFARFVPWLMLNRNGLDILIHPNTDRPRDDHLVHAMWMGEVLEVYGHVVPERHEPEHERTPIVPNTRPTLAA